MSTLLIIAAVLVCGCAAFVLMHILRAPPGHEDRTGFHLEQPTEKPAAPAAKSVAEAALNTPAPAVPVPTSVAKR